MSGDTALLRAINNIKNIYVISIIGGTPQMKTQNGCLMLPNKEITMP
jgi:hypothetical protein